MRRLFRLIGRAAALLLFCPGLCHAWSFRAHETINGTACDLVPAEASPFFQANKDYIVRHSGDPDLWAQGKLPDGRRVSPEEPPRHFIDLDELDEPPFEKIPQLYEEAVRQFGRDRLNGAGTVPYRIQDLTRRLTAAFERKDWSRAVRLASWLGHYTADAHMPLHTTKNYDGKETGNDGIHKRFEVEMIDRFPEFTTLTASPARPVRYVRNVPAFVFAFTLSSYRYVSKLLQADDVARQADPNLGDRYFRELHDASAGRLAMQRMTDSAYDLAALWYTAWVDAGKPRLPDTPAPQLSDDATPRE
jgi:hypothetical protein